MTKKETGTGNIVNIEFDMTKPMKMNSVVEFNKISLFVGPNGSGKTLILKMLWFANTVAMGAVKEKTLPLGMTIIDLAQFTLNHTFDNCDFEGSLKVNYERGSIKIAFVNGNVIGVEPDLQDVTDMAVPIFMSKDARTFNQIKMIMQLQATVGQEKTLEMVKLYDLVYIEFLKKKLAKGLPITKEFKQSLDDFGLKQYDMQSFKIDNSSVYFTDSKGKDTEMTVLSAGEQSIVNMFIGSKA